jgi:hypothetical protein
MKSAYEYWTSKFGETPKRDSEKLAVAMMAEYGREMWNQAIDEAVELMFSQQEIIEILKLKKK